MERDVGRLLRLLDYIAVMLAGGVSALLAGYLVPSGWPLSVGMLVGMLLGTMVLSIVVLGFSWFAGPFEIVMPGMPAVMITGMLCGMMAASGSPAISTLATFGVCIGLSLQAVFHIYDTRLHGEVKDRG
jgi:hypothetical protein